MTLPLGARRASCDAVAATAVKALFHVTAAAGPSVLPRLIGPVAKLGYVPTRMHASAEAGDGSELTVDLRIANLPMPAAASIERALRSVVGVRQVIAVFERAP